MEAFERRMAGIRAGEILPPADDSYNAQEDMKALSNAHKKKKTDNSSYLTTEHLMELRKVQNERVQVRIFVNYISRHLSLTGVCRLVR